jgi:hypothetical protein
VNDHIAPQTGTILSSQRLQSDLHVYHLENFDDSWWDIVQKASLNITEADKSRFENKTDYRTLRESQADPLNTTALTKAYFGTNGRMSSQKAININKNNRNNDYGRSRSRSRSNSSARIENSTAFDYRVADGGMSERGGNSTNFNHRSTGSSNMSRQVYNMPSSQPAVAASEWDQRRYQHSEGVKPAAPSPIVFMREERFLRAICRIYATDFICLGYEFPPMCQDIQREFDQYIENKQRKWSTINNVEMRRTFDRDPKAAWIGGVDKFPLDRHLNNPNHEKQQKHQHQVMAAARAAAAAAVMKRRAESKQGRSR